MSTNLLSIETAFLSNAEVKQALRLNEIRTIQRSVTNAQKKKFEQSIVLSAHVKTAFEWFTSEEGKAKMQEEGIAWSNEEFFNKVFGWQKSFSYKILKVGKLPSETIERFNDKCEELESEGKEPNRSVEGLLKFAKQVEEGTEEGGEGEGEGEGEGAQVETRAQTIFTMTYKTPEGNISIRINDAGEIKTTNTGYEIRGAINFLIDAIRG